MHGSRVGVAWKSGLEAKAAGAAVEFSLDIEIVDLGVGRAPRKGEPGEAWLEGSSAAPAIRRPASAAAISFSCDLVIGTSFRTGVMSQCWRDPNRPGLN